MKKEDENQVLLRINTFGPFLKKEELKKIPEDQFLSGILEQFFDRPIDTISKRMLNRFIEITTKETHLSITPGYKHIIEKVVDPLALAKRYYCLGEYVSCIALSGLIGEMLAILSWKITELKLNNVTISPEQEKNLFGKKFEGYMGQERRINILKELAIISENGCEKFINIAKIRNKYLHSWERNSKQAKGDAKKVITYALELFKSIFNINIILNKKGEQKITMNPKVLKLLKSEGKG